MARANTPQREGRGKKKVFFKVRVGEEYTEYKAVYDGYEFEGVTMGDKNDVREIVRRILRAVNDPPERVVRATVLVVDYIASAVNSGAEVAWGGMAVGFGQNERLKLGANLHYLVVDDPEDLGGWVGEVMASFDGSDGFMVESFHKVVKRVLFGDEVDVMRLYRELLRVARHAYNAWPSY
jgi:hypothetical protein